MTTPTFNPKQCFVHIRDIRDEKFVQFDFAIGDPLCNLEMVLPVKAFEEFCANNKVTHMSEEEAKAVDRDRAQWSYGRNEHGKTADFIGKLDLNPE
ncbi:MAG: phenol hydroxylase subunit [SAR324 cluster bacterium]|nr:phenol hydroxylase subunit [SAR324 cluster bacterium]